MFFLCSDPPFNSIFYKPKVGAYINNDNIVAAIVDQKMSDMTVYIAEYGYQYKSILPEKVPLIITIKCTRYIQNETFARGENILWPKIYFDGSFLHPNMAANMQKYTPIMNKTLLKEL